MISSPFAVRLASSAVVIGALVFSAGQAAAQEQAQQQQQQQSAQGSARSELAKQDREFVTKAAQGGMLEVQAAQLARERAADPEVKRFAETLLKDHQAANQKLEGIAKQKGIDLPKELEAKHKNELDKLRQAKGEDFDRMFVERFGIKEHKQDIDLFERQAKQGKDKDLRAFAEQTLPALHKHMSMAQNIADDGERAQAGQERPADRDTDSDR